MISVGHPPTLCAALVPTNARSLYWSPLSPGTGTFERMRLVGGPRLLLLDLTSLAFCDASGLNAIVRIAMSGARPGFGLKGFVEALPSGDLTAIRCVRPSPGRPGARPFMLGRVPESATASPRSAQPFHAVSIAAALQVHDSRMRYRCAVSRPVRLRLRRGGTIAGCVPQQSPINSDSRGSLP